MHHGLPRLLAWSVVVALSSAMASGVPTTVRWRARLDAAMARSRKERGANFVQLATVDASGAPHCRSVVCRGFEAAAGENGDVLRMVTDTRSDKVAQLVARPEAELVWWFARSSEQFRIAGPVEIVAADDALSAAFSADALARATPNAAIRDALLAARKQQWGNLSDQAREQFFHPTPGRPLGAEPAADVPAGGRDAATGRVLEPPRSFALLLLRPRRVDYLCLHGNLRQIDEAGAGARDDANGAAGAWSETLVVG